MNKENKIKPELASGFRDLSGSLLATEKRLIKVIENNYLKNGYQEISQPSLEIASQIGSFLADDESNNMSDVFLFETKKESLMLRYDLTSQMTRMVASNYRDLPNIFKNYRLGNVWRQDKPSPGRQREFFQADFDVLGPSNEAQTDSEICNIIIETLIQSGLEKNQFSVNITNLKIIQGLIIDILKISDPKKIQQISKSIDKKSRLGMAGVKDLLGKGRKDDSGAWTPGCDLSNNQIDEIINFLQIKELKDLKYLKNKLSIEGIDETEKLLEQASYGDYLDQIELSLEIQRGLSYYSSYAVETYLKNIEIKNDKGKKIDISGMSIASGGRYKNLTSRFGIDIEGSGASIGVTRLSYFLNQIENKSLIKKNTPVVICVLEDKFYKEYYEILKILRKDKINSEIYPGGNVKLQKQLQYCDKRSASIAIICGSEEFNTKKINYKVIKSTNNKNQFSTTKENLVNEIKKFI